MGIWQLTLCFVQSFCWQILLQYEMLLHREHFFKVPDVLPQAAHLCPVVIVVLRPFSFLLLAKAWKIGSYGDQSACWLAILQRCRFIASSVPIDNTVKWHRQLVIMCICICTCTRICILYCCICLFVEGLGLIHGVMSDRQMQSRKRLMGIDYVWYNDDCKLHTFTTLAKSFHSDEH